MVDMSECLFPQQSINQATNYERTEFRRTNSSLSGRDEGPFNGICGGKNGVSALGVAVATSDNREKERMRLKRPVRSKQRIVLKIFVSSIVTILAV